ncbi:MAG TPA: FAD-dependent oxidoreductase [Actinotalea sp.]|jgi:oxygen-dependent protoporphyrinogen oxidase
MSGDPHLTGRGPHAVAGGPDRRPDVVVVGGGVAGLVVARDLVHAGLKVTVLEAADRLGGLVASHEVAGLRLDAGAESFATRSPAVGDLIDELELTDRVVLPNPAGAWVRLPDRTVPLPRAGILGIPGRLWSRDVRDAVGVLGSLRASLDRVLPGRIGFGPLTPDEAALGDDATSASLGHLVRTRMGRRVHDNLVAPVVTGVHSAHPDDMDLDTVLPGVRETMLRRGSVPGASSLAGVMSRTRAAAPAGSAVAGLVGGMNRLVAALVADVECTGGTVSTGVRVEAVAPRDDGSWWIVTAGGEGMATGRVVLAVPGPVAGRLLRELVPEIDEVAGASDTGAVLATLVLDAPELDSAPRGTGVLVAEGVTDVTAKALTHGTAKWEWLAEKAGPGRHVLRLSYGRAGKSLPPGTGDTLQDTALADASTLLGVSLTRAQVVGFARTVWEDGLPRALPGQQERVARVRSALGRLPGLHACGSWFAGTGLSSVVADARRTAHEVLLEVGPHRV